MIFTLTKTLTFTQAGEIIASRCQRTQARLYRKLMKRLKAITKKPLVKALFKLKPALERSLKVIMCCLHRIEKTYVFRLSAWFAHALVLSVRKDGLKFTILLTSLSYVAWCYFI